MSAPMVDITGISKTFHLLKEVNNKFLISVIEVAKEYGVKKTSLIEYIEANPKLFDLVTEKKSALLIRTVYLDASDNPKTDEWLQKQIITRAKYFEIKEYDNYGYISGYYIQIDDTLWLNTKQKVMEIVDRFHLKPAMYVFGGYGDCSTVKPKDGFEINLAQIETLKSEGYTFSEFRPLYPNT